MWMRRECLPLLVACLAFTYAIKVPPGVLEKLKGLSLDEVKCQPDGPGSDISVAVGDTFRMKKGGEIYECICGLPFCEKLKQTVADVAACCKLDDGTCVKSGKTWYDEKSCDNLKCGSKGNKPKPTTITKGCELKNGKCLRHGQSGKEDCNDVKCENGELKITGPGCKKSDGSCAKTGSSWYDAKTCDSLKCERQGEIAKVTIVNKGCYGSNGKCVRSNDVIKQDCNKMKCQNGKLVISEPGCKKADGSCAKPGDVWSDKDSCDAKKCTVPNGKPEITDFKKGCDDGNGKCVKDGGTVNKDCNEMKCENGKLVIVEPRCKKPDGQCVKVGVSWTDGNCEVFQCVKKGDGAEIKDMGKGCKDSNGKCVKHGDSTIADCMTSICENGQLKPTKHGCPKPGGGCYKSGEVVDDDCSKKECEDGKLIMSVAGCKKSDGSCAKVGDTWNDPESCDKKECQKNGATNTTVKRVASGCKKADGTCVVGGHTWFDLKTCTEYACQKRGEDTVRVVVGEGCKNKAGVCIKHGEEATAGCSVHRCVNGKLTTKKSGCAKEGGGCYADGEDFSEKCTEKKCVDGEVVVKKGGCQTAGKRCVSEDTVQVDKKNCTMMVCRKVGKEYKMVAAGAKCKHPETGECIPIGEDFEDESTCSQMVCEEKGKGAQLRVAKKGCRTSDGKCLANHEKVENECETLICQDGELKAEKQGCKKKDGGCYKEGETYTDKCINMKCIDGENKVIDGGCVNKGNDKSCLKVGEKTRDNQECKTVECVKDGDDYVLKHVSSDCATDSGVCIKKFHVLIDQKTCKELQCKPKGELDASLVEVGRGCPDGKGGCLRHSGIKNFECSTSTCINGEMKVIKAGCKRKDGTCAADQEQFTEKGEKCTKYACRNGKIEKVDQDCVNPMDNGRCVSVGDEYSNPKDCNTYECKKQGDKYKMVSKSEGCISRTGECVADSESWEDKKKCEAFKCMRVDGKLKMVQIRKDCISVYDKCYEAGSKEQFTCEVDGYEYHRCDCLKGPPPYPGIGKKKPYPGHPHTIAREGPIKQEGVCKFPFEWGGRKFGSCTMRGWPRLWCGTERAFKTRHWGQCLPEADVPTSQGKKCHFPFKYNKEWQHECIRDKTPWCSLTENYDEDQQKANCILTPLQLNGYKPVNNQLTYQGQCVIPFKYRGKIVRDCVRPTWQRPWCSLDYNYDKSKRWGYCVTWKMWRVWHNYKP